MTNLGRITIELVLTFIVPGFLIILSIIWLSSLIFNVQLAKISLLPGYEGWILFIFSLLSGYLVDSFGHVLFDKSEKEYAMNQFKETLSNIRSLKNTNKDILYSKVIGLFEKNAFERLYDRRSQAYLYYESARNIFIVWFLFVPSFSLHMREVINYYGFFLLLLQIPLYIHMRQMRKYYYDYCIRFTLASESNNQKEQIENS